jgi:hypothetical protein
MRTNPAGRSLRHAVSTPATLRCLSGLRASILASSILAIAGLADAATFTANNGAGISTIGPGGDYTSLAAAAADFSGPQAVTGNYTFLITGDLTETANSFFGKNTAGFTVTLKPADGVSPTVTFTRTNDNSGASGNLIIGASADNSNWAAAFVKTDGFTIDGSNDLGTRQLTITNSGVTHSFQSLITIVGDSDNVKIHNTRLINTNTGGGASIAGIRIASRRQTTAPAGQYIPDGFEILNNEIRVTSATQGHGINMTGSTSGANFDPGVGNSNWKVNNNTIEARIRGVFINQGLANSEIINNNITLNAPGGYLAGGIHVNNANAPAANTFTVAKNRIHVTSSNTNAGAFGPLGIAVTSMGNGADRIANIINNSIHLITTNTNDNTGGAIRGIWASSAIANRILNNSIYIQNNPNITGAMSPTNSFAIGGWAANIANEAIIQNNLVVINQAGIAGIMRDTTAAPIGNGFVSDNNVITPTTGAFFGRYQSANYATRADWNTASSQDANSNDTFNPVNSGGAAWNLTSIPNTLKFTPLGVVPTGMPGFNRVSTPVAVTDDNESELRTVLANKSWPGSDEGTVPAPVSISEFSIE